MEGQNLKELQKLNFCEKLRLLRELNNLSYEKLGRLTKLSNTALFNLEKGNSLPTSETIIKLCKLFKVDANFLLNTKPNNEDYSFIIVKNCNNCSSNMGGPCTGTKHYGEDIEELLLKYGNSQCEEWDIDLEQFSSIEEYLEKAHKKRK